MNHPFFTAPSDGMPISQLPASMPHSLFQRAVTFEQLTKIKNKEAAKMQE
jgi:hypothetical protein